MGINRVAFLKDASKYAQQHSDTQLGAFWLNNSTNLFISRALQAQFVQGAIEQNVVLFREEGLTVLAAPWSYALCGKTNRISSADKRSYDICDAVGYLHEYVVSSDKKGVEANELIDWGKVYEKTVTMEALKEINDAYKDTYGKDGIIFG